MAMATKLSRSILLRRVLSTGGVHHVPPKVSTSARAFATQWAPATLCIHAGAQKDAGGSMVTPIYTSVATVWPNPKEQHIYPRYNKGPNVEVVAARIAKLENAEAGCVFASGMAAITSVLYSFLDAGDHCVMSEVYGATFELGSKDFPRRGIENSFVTTRRVEDFEAALRPETKVLYLETPSNPLISVLDLEAVIKIGRQKCGKNLIVIVDNTFSTPINTQPLSLDADVVIHSATKFLNGHSDLQAGVAVSSREHIENIRQNVIMYGGGLNALEAYQLERGLMTFDLRMRAHNANAQRLAEFLEGHPSVARVLYPGLPSHPGYAIAQRQMKGGGAMLAFDLACDDSTGVTANHFLKALQLSTPARSLGGCHTTVCLPAETSHARLSEAERLDIGIGPGLVRVSVGIEAAEDIIADFDAALRHAVQKAPVNHRKESVVRAQPAVRVGLLGFGTLGRYLAEQIQASEDLDLAFVWNRSPSPVRDAMSAGELGDFEHVEDLTEVPGKHADIVVEVSHPDVSRQVAEKVLASGTHFYAGSPTAFADANWSRVVRAACTAKSVFVPVGALWGGFDLERMAERGLLKSLKVTMKFHPKSLKLNAPLSEKLAGVVKGQECVLFEGSVRELAPLAPNNVNTMVCAALASGDALGLDNVQARLVADDSLEAHIICIEAEGQDGFKVETVRTNPAAAHAVTGQLTYASFFTSLKSCARVLGTTRAGVHLC